MKTRILFEREGGSVRDGFIEVEGDALPGSVTVEGIEYALGPNPVSLPIYSEGEANLRRVSDEAKRRLEEAMAERPE